MMGFPRCDAELDGVIWARTSKEAPIEPTPLAEGAEYDLAVVGGGFLGLNIALHGARMGLKIGLFEGGTVGSGASGRNGGIAAPHFPGALRPSDVSAGLGRRKGEALAEIVTTGGGFIFDQIRELGIQCDAEQNGWIQPGHSSKALAKVRAVHDDWKSFGAEIEWVDADYLRQELGAAGYLGGWRHPTGGTLNPLANCRGLARAAQAAGAAIHERVPITAVARDGDGINLTVVGGTRCRARKVFLATNGYTDGLWPGLAGTVIPLRLFQTFTEPLAEEQRAGILPSRQCFTDLRKSGGFCRWDSEGRIMSGCVHFAIGNGHARGVRHTRMRLKELYPQLADAKLQFYWEGYCALRPDFIPRFQILDKDVFSLVGFSTRAVCLAQTMGKVAAEFLAERRTLDDIPVAVSTLDPVPRQAFRRMGTRVIYPYFRALDRWGLS